MTVAKFISYVACTLLLFFCSANLHAQVCGKKVTPENVADLKELVGQWTGEITVAGQTYSMTATVSQNNDGLLVTIYDGSSSKNVTTAVSICAPAKYHFYGTLPDGRSFSYSPRLNKGVLSGGYQVGDVCSLDKPKFSLTKLH